MQNLNLDKTMSNFSKLNNTAANVTTGATATSASMGDLAFGAGVLLVGMAVALAAKTIFNIAKLLGSPTNGVKASDFDLSFQIFGLVQLIKTHKNISFCKARNKLILTLQL